MRRCGGMVDTRDLKSLVGNNVPVRVRLPAPKLAAPLGVLPILVLVVVRLGRAPVTAASAA